MKKTMTAAGAVVALMVMPGVSSASTFVGTPVLPATSVGLHSQSQTEDPTPTEEVDPSGSVTPSTSADPSDSVTPSSPADQTESGDPQEPSDSSEDDADSEETEESAPGDTDVDVVDDAPTTGTGVITPGSGLSDEDGDGKPEKVDRIDDDGDGKVDEIDKKAQVSVVPDGGAETGDGSTGGAVGMTLGGGAVLALLGGLAVWVRRAMSRY